jgi:DNA-binding CsgD family transcriptional regulator
MSIKKEMECIKMTVKEIVRMYRQTRKAIESVTIPRLTAIAYVGQLQDSDRRTADRQARGEEIDRQFKAEHFPDSPLTLRECVALKPKKRTAEEVSEKIASVSDSIHAFVKEYNETTDKTERQAIDTKIKQLQCQMNELTFYNSRHTEYDRVNYTWDMIANDSEGNIITDLCKIITYCSCKKSVTREGTKTQYDMYYACCRADWEHPDVADVLSVATLATFETLTADEKQLEKDVYFLEKSVEMLKHLNPIADTAEIKKIVTVCKRHCNVITDDYRANRRTANRYKWMLRAVTEKSIDNLIHAVFLAINNYFVLNRSIHVSDNFTVNSIESDYEYYCNIPESETKIDLLFNDSDKKEKRQAILSAYHKVSDILTKSELTTFKYLIKGYTVSQIAYKRKISKPTISIHIASIRSAFSRFIASDPLQYTVIADCIIINSDSPKTDSEKTAEKKTDRQLETDRIKASMTDGLKDGIKEQIIQTLDNFELRVYKSLLKGTIRQTAELLKASKTKIGRVQTDIIKAVFDTIDSECQITVNRDLFKKITLSELIQIFD